MENPFTVSKAFDWEDDKKVQTGLWAVYLPHQCDAWEIAGGNWDSYPQEKAIEMFEEFLAQGQEALTALKEGKEFGLEED